MALNVVSSVVAEPGLRICLPDDGLLSIGARQRDAVGFAVAVDVSWQFGNVGKEDRKGPRKREEKKEE